MEKKKAFVYILTNYQRTVLYSGVTNNIARRIAEHKNEATDSFTKKYKVSRLVYYEVLDAISDAITREKQLKGGSRSKKLLLINSMNPGWRDLSNDF